MRLAVAAALGGFSAVSFAQSTGGPPSLPSAVEPLPAGPATSVLPNAGSVLTVPGKAERSESRSETKFRVAGLKLVGAQDHPQAGLTVASLQGVLDAAVAGQPAEGYTLTEWDAAVAQKVADAYHKAGFPLVVAFFPAQSAQNGQLVVQVLEGRLAGLHVESNKHYSVARIEAPFLDQRGLAFNQAAIESRLARVNDYPGLQVFGVVVPGESTGDADVIFRVKEKPFDFFAGGDNWGPRSVGDHRVDVGFAWNNPLGLGDRFGAMVLRGLPIGSTASDRATKGARTVFYNVDYRAPFALAGRLAAEASYSRNAYTPGEFVNTTGVAQVGDIGIDYLLMRTRFTRIEGFLKGYDKTAELSIAGGALRQNERVHDAQLGFSFYHLDNWGQWSASAADTHGTSAQTANPIRAGSATSYNMGSFEAERLQRVVGSVLVRLHVAGLASSSALPSLEQFSLTGPTAVRAYEVGHLPVDRGYFGNAEVIVGAPFFASRPGPGGRPWGEALQLIGFYDAGHGSQHDTVIPGLSENLKGWGGGVAFNWGRSFAFRLDAAKPISPTALDETITGKSIRHTRYFGSLKFNY